MSKEAQVLTKDEIYGSVFSEIKPNQWVQLGKSYFFCIPPSSHHFPSRAERIELNNRFMVFAFYRSGRGGNEDLLAYEVRPMIPPQLEVVGAALFLRYGDDDKISLVSHTKSKVGDKRWPLIIVEYENGDVMFTLG
jgi:hypothetical protein